MNFQNRAGRGGGRPMQEDAPLNAALKIMITRGMRSAIEDRAFKRGITLGAAAREFLRAGMEAKMKEAREDRERKRRNRETARKAREREAQERKA